MKGTIVDFELKEFQVKNSGGIALVSAENDITRAFNCRDIVFGAPDCGRKKQKTGEPERISPAYMKIGGIIGLSSLALLALVSLILLF